MDEYDKVMVLRNRDIEKVIAFIPRGHKHIRLLIDTKIGMFIFHEATVAAMVRAYINIKTHPQKNAIEMVLRKFSGDDVKEGYDIHQLIESDKSDEEILDYIEAIMKSG